MRKPRKTKSDEIWFPETARPYPKVCDLCHKGTPVAWFKENWLCGDCLCPPLTNDTIFVPNCSSIYFCQETEEDFEVPEVLIEKKFR